MRFNRWIGVGAVGLAISLSGCDSSASSNGLTSKSAKQILDESLAAMKTAESVTLTGSITSNGAGLGLDLDLTSTGAVGGSIDESNEKLDVIVLGSKDYLKAPAAFWESSGHLSSSQAAAIAPHWVAVPSASTSSFSSLSLAGLSKSLSTNNGTLSKAGTKTINGESSIGVHSSKGGTLWVRSAGDPYPVAIIGALGTSSADVNFSNWNSAPLPVAPKGALSGMSSAVA
jgi:hypothetical protein